MVTRTRRVAIDGGFEQSGNHWYQDSGSFESFGSAGYAVFFLQYFSMKLGGNRTEFSAVTLWSSGLLSLGQPTDEQITFMASGESPIPGVDGAGFPGEFFLFDYTEGVEHSSYSFGIGGVDYTPPFLDGEKIRTAFFTFNDSFQIIVDEDGFSIIEEDFSDNEGTNGYYIGGLGFQTNGNEIAFDNYPEFFTYSGTAGSDTIVGTIYAELFLSGAGADSIDGAGEADQTRFALDVVSYASSAAGVSVNLATGTGSGGDAVGDTLVNVEALIGSAHADTLIGDGLFNRIEGGAGADAMDGGALIDLLSYAGSSSGVDVSLTRGTGSGGDAAGDTFANFEDLQGSAWDDILEGSAAANFISGGTGDDVLIGLAGNDSLYGGAGDDFFIGGSGADSLLGDAGSDTASYAGSPAAITVNLGTGSASGGDAAGDYAAVDNVIGSAFNDTIIGHAYFDNRFEGGPGNDTLDGGFLDGAPGGTYDADTAIFSGNRASYAWQVVGGETHVQGPDGSDTLTRIERMQFADATYAFGPAGFGAPALALPGFGAGSTAGSWSSGTIYPRTMADVSGDGWPDIAGFGDGGVYLALGNGSGGFGSAFLAVAGFGAGASAGGWSSNDAFPRMLADVDGNGFADVVGYGDGGVYVALSSGGGIFDAAFLATPWFGKSASAGGWTGQNLYPRLFGDVNGDGMDDIVGFGDGGVLVSLAAGAGTFADAFLATAGFGASAAAGGWSNNDLYTRTLADLNGDGRADIIGFGSGGVHVALANADGTFASPFYAFDGFGAEADAGGWTSNDLYYRTAGDIDGDGNVDLAGFGDGGVYVAYGNGAGGFTPTAELVLPGFGANATAGGWTSQDLYPRLLADLNGDGAADILGFGDGGVITATSVSGWVLV